ncbi:WxL domain-containing protein [Enterococcus sp. LJL120]|uniref:WxL domain-containing protein n=1 Tax=Enterococcus sp. HY326 TaxID=2971265 RepID=UPI00223EDB19|nr:WxL domain-containing protein [Enterococcus sp. HY326]
MKFKTLSAVALLAVVGVATTAPAVTNAATPSSQTSQGTVKVEAGSLDPGKDGVPDPEGGKTIPGVDPVIPNPTSPGDKGITAVTNLNFGTIKVGTGTASAQPITITDTVTAEDGSTTSTTRKRGNLISWGDVTGEYTGYTISGQLTTQFTNSSDQSVLTGSEIAFINPLIATSGEGTIADSGKTATQTLSIDGGAKTFVTAAAGTGSGQWTLEWGSTTDGTGATDTTVGTVGSSVNLTIPTSVANSMTKGTYTAVVTWTMGALA